MTVTIIVDRAVIALAGDPKWTTEAGLACGGPKVYGYVLFALLESEAQLIFCST